MAKILSLSESWGLWGRKAEEERSARRSWSKGAVLALLREALGARLAVVGVAEGAGEEEEEGDGGGRTGGCWRWCCGPCWRGGSSTPAEQSCWADVAGVTRCPGEA